MEDLVREGYYDFLIENNLEDNQENINHYIAGIYYDIQDNIDNLSFNVPSDLDGLQTQIYIEQMIENILKGV